MDISSTQWMIGLLGFAGGIAFGALIYHFTRSDDRDKERLETEVSDLHLEHEQYREDVAQHFATTARLVNQLTESYRDVHAHLAQGAQALCDDNEALRKQLSSSLANRLMADEDVQPEEAKPQEAEAAPVEPPKDYAPKSAPNEKGTLHEEFGHSEKAR